MWIKEPSFNKVSQLNWANQFWNKTFRFIQIQSILKLMKVFVKVVFLCSCVFGIYPIIKRSLFFKSSFFVKFSVSECKQISTILAGGKLTQFCFKSVTDCGLNFLLINFIMNQFWNPCINLLFSDLISDSFSESFDSCQILIKDL